MDEPHLSMAVDDDLPRTLRREKEARQREARERQTHEYAASTVEPIDAENDYAFETDEVSVRYLKVPFFHLMFFFIKAVFAAIPALIILGAILYGAGQLLKAYFPWLIQAEILIKLPNN